jgi:lactate dehydrogenase-like 2-hydroxyacid dehydrogenase
MGILSPPLRRCVLASCREKGLFSDLCCRAPDVKFGVLAGALQPADHPFRTMDNVLATPHLGYVTEHLYRTFYGDTVRNIVAWLDRWGN